MRSLLYRSAFASLLLPLCYQCLYSLFFPWSLNYNFFLGQFGSLQETYLFEFEEIILCRRSWKPDLCFKRSSCDGKQCFKLWNWSIWRKLCCWRFKRSIKWIWVSSVFWHYDATQKDLFVFKRSLYLFTVFNGH